MGRIKRTDITRQVTLYRIKEPLDIQKVNFDGYAPVLRVNNKKTNYSLHFLKPLGRTANWYNVFSKADLDLTEFNENPPVTMLSGFILLVKYKTSYYAFTGGMGFHALQKILEIEPRFGIGIAKKILTQENLRGLVQKDSGGFLNSLDRVFKPGYHPMSDIDNLHRVLTTLRASGKKGESFIKDNDYEIGRSIRAGDSLCVTGQKDLMGMIQFVEHVENIWNRSSSETLTIPELDFISSKHEKNLIQSLNKELCNTIKNNPQINSLYIDDMDIGLISDRIERYTLKHKRDTFELASIDDVFLKLSELIKRDADLDNVMISFNSQDGMPVPPEKKVKYYICGDIVYQDKVYFYISNRWYRANEDYVSRIDNFLNEIHCHEMTELHLPKWDKCKDEDDYNYQSCANDFTVLHKHFIHPGGGVNKLELCDLLRFDGDKAYWIHVKHASGAGLRELFSQGYVSAQLYQSDNAFKDKVHNAELDKTASHTLSQHDKDGLMKLSTYSLNKIHIVYAIYDDKHAQYVKQQANQSKTIDVLGSTLTLYAKIDLLRRHQDIRALGYNVGIVRIET